MSNLGSFLKSRTFVINLVILLVFLLIVFGGVSSWMSSFTHHGESISVPDLRGQKMERMPAFLADKHLQFKVIDSLFDLEKNPGTVLEQDPAPNSKVKEGRTIYLTVNAQHPPDVKMPNLIDVSYRQAEAILVSFGLRVGQLTYRPDLAKNAVLDQRFKGSSISPGKNIPKGSKIDLTLGDGLGSVEVPVPDLTGSPLDEALFVLKGSSLNVGTIYYDKGVRDSTKAIIYRQEPAAGGNSTMNQGEAIDIYLR
ncbi:MAG: PASTA domain-containing protein [Bacteroidetes bacterium]|nr:PASTA domain-containing protein [Bacteroidota bacterium]MBK8362651.1 PASTA domain-containing protein [Bacteroidota bacterium]MBK9412641.1 PASTA domain-containing protein [Bacteroidota bacterium]MBP6428377.1 PASTA domain-containing protein [Bacteroidia bacterium]MBP6656888.1 PASTA domain-containing protein [Bacteroidia bacterium]